MKPLGTQVAVLPIKEEDRKTQAGIILNAEKPVLAKGKIAFVGKDATDSVSEGETAVFAVGAGTPFIHNGVDYILMSVHEIKAVI